MSDGGPGSDSVHAVDRFLLCPRPGLKSRQCHFESLRDLRQRVLFTGSVGADLREVDRLAENNAGPRWRHQ